MNEFFEKIKSIGSDVDSEIGGVVLFGVFKPAEAPQRWDVIVSADWVGDDATPAIFYIARKLQEGLDEDELVSISRVEALPPASDFVRSVLNAVRVTGEGAHLENRVFNGIPIMQAYIAIANPDSHSHASLPVSATQISARASIRRAAEKANRRTATSASPRKR